MGSETLAKAEPQQEHRWLRRLLGEWTYETEGTVAPGEPPVKCAGSESVRALGELWVVCEGEGEMPDGGAARTITTLGYDPQRKRFVGTWIGSMMTHLWVYEGELDPAGKVLALDTEGPSCETEGETARFQDVIEFEDEDHRTLRSRFLGEDGEWHWFMTAHYRRR